MDRSTCDTIDAILEAVEGDIDDANIEFKLRTARQLLMVCRDQNETYRQALAEADLAEETRQSLVELGYLSS